MESNITKIHGQQHIKTHKNQRTQTIVFMRNLVHVILKQVM